MTPDRLRDEARLFERFALRYALSPFSHGHLRDYYRGSSDAYRSAARILRRAAAHEENYEVRLFDAGPRAVQVAR